MSDMSVDSETEGHQKSKRTHGSHSSLMISLILLVHWLFDLTQKTVRRARVINRRTQSRLRGEGEVVPYYDDRGHVIHAQICGCQLWHFFAYEDRSSAQWSCCFNRWMGQRWTSTFNSNGLHLSPISSWVLYYYFCQATVAWPSLLLRFRAVQGQRSDIVSCTGAKLVTLCSRCGWVEEGQRAEHGSVTFVTAVSQLAKKEKNVWPRDAMMNGWTNHGITLVMTVMKVMTVSLWVWDIDIDPQQPRKDND